MRFTEKLQIFLGDTTIKSKITMQHIVIFSNLHTAILVHVLEQACVSFPSKEKKSFLFVQNYTYAHLLEADTLSNIGDSHQP